MAWMGGDKRHRTCLIKREIVGFFPGSQGKKSKCSRVVKFRGWRGAGEGGCLVKSEFQINKEFKITMCHLIFRTYLHREYWTSSPRQREMGTFA